MRDVLWLDFVVVVVCDYVYLLNGYVRLECDLVSIVININVNVISISVIVDILIAININPSIINSLLINILSK